MSQSFSAVPPPAPQPATRQGQREIVAATLVAGLIASTQERVTTEQVMEKMHEVLELLTRQ